MKVDDQELASLTMTNAPHHEYPVLVDLRDAQTYQRKTLQDAAHLPIHQLVKRMYELPPPGEYNLALLGSDDQTQAARAILEPKGWKPDLWRDDDPQVWRRRPHQTGPSRTLASRPNAFLQRVCNSLALPDEPGGVVVDVGCGSGRDACFLEHELRRRRLDWSVVGVDNHLRALERARQLARAHGCTRTRFCAADLRKGGLDTVLGEVADQQPLRLVHGCRYMDGPLLAGLRDRLAPGGAVVWSTFADAAVEGMPTGAREGRRLRRSQLSEWVGEASGFEVLHSSEGVLLTRGEWVPATFWASRLRSPACRAS